MATQGVWQWLQKLRFPSHPYFLGIFVIALTAFSFARGLRCYTDVMATKAHSVECGLNTGCVKMFIDSEEMLLRRNQQYGLAYPTGEGAPALPDKYLGNPILLRGCFVLAVPDRCYTANNGLTYCWCSTKDLCNKADAVLRPPARLALVLGVLFVQRFLL